MPLDEFQWEIARVLARHRSPGSVLAGGSVLQRHGFRVSADQDIFHATADDVQHSARMDLDALAAAGYTVEVTKRAEGLIEATVARENRGRTVVQWVQSGMYSFFAPVIDPDFGWRFHYADLSVNKALAAADRRQVRDIVDLYLIDTYILPLWHVLWAAPGKDATWSPESIIERISMNKGMTQAEFDAEVLSISDDISARDVGTSLLDALDRAREVFKTLPPSSVASLLVHSATGDPIRDPADASAADVVWLSPKPGGAWRSDPDIDAALVQRLLDAFGPNGSRLTGDPPDPTDRTKRDPGTTVSGGDAP